MLHGLSSLRMLSYADVERIPTKAPRWQGAFFQTRVEEAGWITEARNTRLDSSMGKDERMRWRKTSLVSPDMLKGKSADGLRE